MEIRPKNTNKYRPVKTTAPAGKRVSSEAVIDMLLGCVIFAAVLLLLGLIHADQSGFRGFPFEWYHRSDFIRYDNMLASYVILLAVVSAAVVISLILGKVNETSIKTSPYTSTPSGVRANTATYKAKEVVTDKPAAGVYAKSIKASPESSKKPANSHREIKPLLKSAVNTAAKEDDDQKKKQNIGIAVAILTLAAALLPMMFLDDDISGDYYYDEDESEYSAYYDTVSETASEAIAWLQSGDVDMLSSVGDMPDDIVLPDLSDTEGELIWDTMTLADTEGCTGAVYRYILREGNDDDEDIYLAAVLLEGDDLVSEPENAAVTGICLYKFGSYNEYSDYYDNVIEGYEEPEAYVDLSRCISIGKNEINGTHILYYC